MSGDLARLIAEAPEPPPWLEVCAPRGYQIKRDGVFRDCDDDKPPVRLTGTPVWVTGLTRDENGKQWGRLVRWVDLDGSLQEWAVPLGRFHESGPGLAQDLATGGLHVIPSQEQGLRAFLGSFTPDRRFRCVSRLGWADMKGGELVYVRPDEVAGSPGAESEDVVFQAEQFAPVNCMHPQGDLGQWQEAVASYCTGNPVLLFAACWALAPPLLKAAGLGGIGVHIFGTSSSGKTTAGQIAASVWGCGADPAAAPDLTMIRSWRATANALEGVAAAHSDAVLVLDEIGSTDVRDVGSVVYSLAGGQGKSRMTDRAILRQARSWRILFLSSGEVSMRQKIEEGGRTAHAGQLLRALDLPAAVGIICNTRGMAHKNYVDQLKARCGEVYGTAGPAFVRGLIDGAGGFSELREQVNLVLGNVAKEITPSDADPQQSRAIRYIALGGAAGIMAAKLGVLPWSETSILDAVVFARDAWFQAQPHLADAARGVERVRDFMLRHRARFQQLAIPNSSPPRDCAGYLSREGDLYLFTDEGFREAVGDLDPTGVARELRALGRLHLDRPNGLKIKTPQEINGSRPRVYAVKTALLDGEGEPE